MVGKNVWPSFGPPPSHIHEHGTLLLVHTAAMLLKVQNKESPPLSVVETLLKEMSSFLERIKEEPMQKEILHAVQKLAFSTDAHHRKAEQDLTVIKSTVNNIRPNFSSTSLPSNLPSSRSYASMLQGSTSQTLLLPAKATINKEQEIIVRLNDQNEKATLKDVPIDTIMKDLNVRIESLGHHPIRAVKRLPSGDIAVLTINNDATDKLRSDNRWASVLGNNARVVTRTYGIMINGVRVSDFDMGEKEKIIQHIKESNKDIERLQGMDIKWIGWRSMPKAGQELASLVIEFSTPTHANAALDCNILLGREVFGGVVFNRACKSIQCFRCYSYGHITVQCTNKPACGHCS